MPRARTFLVLVFLLAFCISCHSGQPTAADDYHIYTAFLNEMAWGRELVEGVEITSYVVDETTSVYEFDPNLDTQWASRDYAFQNLPGLSESTVTSFVTRNRSPVHLNPDRFGDHTVLVLTESESSRIFSFDRNWHEWYPDFYSQFPHSQGHMALSRPGISADGTQALLYYGNQWRLEAGQGELVLLEYSEKGWTIRARVALWYS